MKAKELRSKTESQLHEELNGLLRAQFNLRMQRGVGQLARHDQFGKARKDVARIKTLLNEMKAGKA